MSSYPTISTSVPGLNHALTKQDLEQSRVDYNDLPNDEDQPPIDNTYLRELWQIFIDHGVENKLGIHLIHGHFKLPRDHVLLGENFGPPACRWARTVPNRDVDVHDIHGHIFKYTDHGLHPYEYQRGKPPSVEPEFLTKFINYIIDNRLESLVGLQVLCREFKSRPMSEIVMDGQTSMWETKILKTRTGGWTTGWSFSREAQEYTAGETHEPLDNGGHRRWNEGASHPEMKTFQDLCEAFVGSQVIDPSAYQSGLLVG